jgi:hypothetical protein
MRRIAGSPVPRPLAQTLALPVHQVLPANALPAPDRAVVLPLAARHKNRRAHRPVLHSQPRARTGAGHASQQSLAGNREGHPPAKQQALRFPDGPDTEVAPATPTGGADLIQVAHPAHGRVAALPSFLSGQVSRSRPPRPMAALAAIARDRDFARPLTPRPLARDRRPSGRTGRRRHPGRRTGRTWARWRRPGHGCGHGCLLGRPSRPVLDASVRSVPRFAPIRGG